MPLLHSDNRGVILAAVLTTPFCDHVYLLFDLCRHVRLLHVVQVVLDRTRAILHHLIRWGMRYRRLHFVVSKVWTKRAAAGATEYGSQHTRQKHGEPS